MDSLVRAVVTIDFLGIWIQVYETLVVAVAVRRPVVRVARSSVVQARVLYVRIVFTQRQFQTTKTHHGRGQQAGQYSCVKDEKIDLRAVYLS